MMTIARHVGRLVEMREDGEPGPANRNQFGRVIALANELGPDAKVFVLTDVRRAKAMPTFEAIEQIATRITATAMRVDLAVLLIRPDPARIIATGRMRQSVRAVTFEVAKSPAEAMALLAPKLDPAELARLKIVLAD
jgi:hypothetical protein